MTTRSGTDSFQTKLLPPFPHLPWRQREQVLTHIWYLPMDYNIAQKATISKTHIPFV